MGGRRILGALLASLMLHGLLVAVPGARLMPGKELPQSALPLSRGGLEVSLGGGGGSEPVLQTMMGDSPATVDIREAGQAVGGSDAEEAGPSDSYLPVTPAPPVVDYMKAGELDVRPSPEIPIAVPFPEGFRESVKGKVVLSLFISVDGVVERVSVGDSDLPPAFALVARQTFLGARFRPGIRNGLATAAQMKIMVEFEQ